MKLHMAVALLVALPVGATCTPDPGYTPTPVISWQHSLLTNCNSTSCDVVQGYYTKLDGFRIYAKRFGQLYSEVWNLRCWFGDDGLKRCRNSFPVQRGGSWDLEDIEFSVTAYSDYYGESSYSLPLTICMPHIWRRGEAYE